MDEIGDVCIFVRTLYHESAQSFTALVEVSYRPLGGQRQMITDIDNPHFSENLEEIFSAHVPEDAADYGVLSVIFYDITDDHVKGWRCQRFGLGNEVVSRTLLGDSEITTLRYADMFHNSVAGQWISVSGCLGIDSHAKGHPDDYLPTINLAAENILTDVMDDSVATAVLCLYRDGGGVHVDVMYEPASGGPLVYAEVPYETRKHAYPILNLWYRHVGLPSTMMMTWVMTRTQGMRAEIVDVAHIDPKDFGDSTVIDHLIRHNVTKGSV